MIKGYIGIQWHIFFHKTKTEYFRSMYSDDRNSLLGNKIDFSSNIKEDKIEAFLFVECGRSRSQAKYLCHSTHLKPLAAKFSFIGGGG